MLTLTRTQLALVLVPLVLLLTVAGSRIAGVGASRGPAAVAPLSRIRSAPAGAQPLLVIHVVGAVRRAGLFRLRDGSRVADALARAGGPTRHADLAAVNLAAPLVDGEQVVVPRRGTGGSAAVAAAPGSPIARSVAAISELLERAQIAGQIRGDLTLADLGVLLAAVPGAGVAPEQRARFVDIVIAGLAAPP